MFGAILQSFHRGDSRILIDMATKNEENWYANYEALKAYVLETSHFPNKHDKRLNWAKFQMKKIKAGTMEPERQRLFEELMAMRSGQHIGGRRKKEINE